MKKGIVLVMLCLISSVSYADHAPLKDVIAERMESSSGADEETKNKMLADIKKIAVSDMIENAINKGDKAPNFTLPDQNGDPVELYSLLEDGPVVLLWYRGVWCPYCNLTLKFYQEELGHIEAHGGQLVAISSQLPDSTLSTAEKNDLDYLVLSDVEGAVGKDYGIIFTLGDEVAQIYKSFGIDLEKHQGNTRNELPLAATYVIDQDGTVRFTFLDADYKKRAEPAHVINTLSRISDIPHGHVH